MGSSAEFSFAECHIQRNEIRLLTLKGGSLDEDISCNLRRHHFSHENLRATKFMALSYCWGDQDDKVAIHVEDKVFKVTRNLRMALQHLRGTNSVVLWVDAICINQADRVEKNHQLEKLRSIYEWAEDVIAWLGPAGSDSDMAMMFFGFHGERIRILERLFTQEILPKDFERRGNLSHFLPLSSNQRQHTLRQKSQALEDLGESMFEHDQHRLRLSIEAILAREYWERMWIVQEVLSAKSLTLACGLLKVPYDNATTVINAFTAKRNQKINEGMNELQSPAPIPTGYRSDDISGLKNYLPIRTPTHATNIGRMAHERLTTPAQLAKDRSYLSSRDPIWLLGLLKSLRHFKSTVPQDKILSLVGLLEPDLARKFRLDSGLSLLEVSIDLCRLCITPPGPYSSKRSINILCLSEPRQGSGFPSWMPDLSRYSGITTWPDARIDGMEWLDQNCKPCPLISLDNTILAVSGLSRTEIVGITEQDDDPFTRDDLGLLTRIRKFEGLLRTVLPGQYPDKQFWSTIILGRYEPTGVSRERLIDVIYPSSNDKPSTFLNIFREESYGRRFATFGSNVYGMVPAAAKKGDRLCVLKKCDFPVILRYLGYEMYEFIGPCFISGSPHAWGKLSVRVFCIR
ncbi:uncharacterized protein K452DRAFT_271807 [Aplosporella prunicola CBS 121167]|uniref:Heterokaryon incompatibility domain-containing protein n=1 Tax=Aplosporella prunicola CBS 121167 TaxID=1176127 RepID=A0A6A6BE14_9PEZI|nr:uncharacterized protein K452DRAFT_271807 [Aplosporella prunicola CBS 121167]KAF2141167.1 hypothetical protein K452DRAFT_271807 [Aplosporella prunicola CBS 121167]